MSAGGRNKPKRKYKYRDLGIYEKYQGPWAIE